MNILEMKDKSGNNVFEKLKEKAFDKYGTIVPCPGKQTLLECLTQDGNKIILWFMPENPTLATSAVGFYNTVKDEYFI